MNRKVPIALGALAGVALSGTAYASDASGDLFYTKYQGTPNVWKVSFTYNDAANMASLGVPVPLASAPGADGIIFAPSGNLLIGGQGTGKVYEYKTDGTFVAEGIAGGGASFHLALDPSGTKVWTSGFSADLSALPLSPNIGNDSPPLFDVTGDNQGVTQVAFAPSGKTFYVDGNPNGFGDIGFIDLSTFVTTKFLDNIEPAHGLLYDSFTGLMTMFGHGHVGTFDPEDPTPADSLLVSAQLHSDFDQGGVDGKGHALVAGGDAITFIDYSTSGDITNPDYVQIFTGFTFIDDVAPLSGLGSNEPPPSGVPDQTGRFVALALLLPLFGRYVAYRVASVRSK